MTLEQARLILAELLPRLAGLVEARADLAELRADLDRAGTSRLGGLAEAKAWEARLYADVEYIAGRGAQVKGWAPLLLDFPGEIAGEPVLWCWLEGDPDIEWYHRLDCGFAGRRRVPAAR
ncbi:MAG: DUF2203 domain-containing protein [Micromonosporaceae bacterium]|nr:DUF2203 domain-containing protein [Micromonosporaceae bacterium]